MTALVTLLMALAQGPTVTVRVVDAFWSALPGATVELIPVQNCFAPQPDRPSESGYTNGSGQIEIALGNSPAYVVRARIDGGGFESRDECVKFGVLSVDTRAYVELRLRLDPAQRVVINEPSTTRETPSGPLVLLEFTGVYRDSAGRHYKVDGLHDGVDLVGLELTLPDGRTLFFTKRDGTKFTGSGGTLAFRVTRRRVTGMSFVPASVSAGRLPDL